MPGRNLDIEDKNLGNGWSEWRWGAQANVVGDTNGDGQVEFMIAGGVASSWIGLFGVPTGSF